MIFKTGMPPLHVTLNKCPKRKTLGEKIFICVYFHMKSFITSASVASILKAILM